MKLHLSTKRNQAWTLTDIAVVIAIMVGLAALLLPVLAATQRRSARINCVSNLKQVNLAFRIWEGDNNNKYPMAVYVTNGGGMELIATGNVAGCFQVMSNELSTPKILVCPEDLDRRAAYNFGDDFNNSHLSYFICPDADEAYPQQIMTGDANLATNGVPVKSGLVVLPSYFAISWSPGRHGAVYHIPWLGIPIQRHYFGNLGYADGSVSEVSTIGLQSAFALATNGTPTMTNRLAIP